MREVRSFGKCSSLVSVFHFRCANIDPRTYGSDILEQRNGMVGHDDLEKLLHIFIVSDECIATSVRDGIPNKAGHRHYAWTW